MLLEEVWYWSKGQARRSWLVPARCRIPLGRLELLQVGIESAEPLFPVLSLAFDPDRNLAKRLGFESTRPPLRLPPFRDEASAFKHLEVLGDRRQTHVERLRQFLDADLSRCESSKNRPPRRIGEGGKRSAKGIVGVHYLIDELIN